MGGAEECPANPGYVTRVLTVCSLRSLGLPAVETLSRVGNGNIIVPLEKLMLIDVLIIKFS